MRFDLLLSRVGIAVAIGFIAAGPVSASTLFSDNFNAGASAAWGNQRGNWRVVDGTYDASSPSNNPVTYTDVTTLPSLTDFMLSVDVSSVNDGGIWLRSQYNGGNVNGVLLVTGGFNGGFNGVYWHTSVGGVFSPGLGISPIAGLQGSTRNITVSVIGNVYSAYINGVLASSIATALFNSGSVGLYDRSPINGASSPRGQVFDNFSVSAVPIPPALFLLGSALLGLFGFRWLRSANVRGLPA